ncbi:hypothetical protein GCM10025872_33690 [Barrientosiimonas endolithica]|uniref:SnoaL-like domain-containing protein n=1 Tax=Barrientosiimonas endolithica TaxID=1535208 RepID=A0ABN6YQP1_9MICO|nr:hypothetical protein GCM10025872_33690 [Barrientosiimonas endolithica]
MTDTATQTDTQPLDDARAWTEQLQTALEAGDVDATLEQFADDCFWRDLISMTWNLHTAEGKDAVGAMLREVGQGPGRARSR